ncbi:hypothetical protein [Vallitalea okinawensis]|nr:hypothetical protein [Vallitalea okinawensis]
MKKQKKSLLNQILKGSSCNCGVEIVEESGENDKNKKDSTKTKK